MAGSAEFRCENPKCPSAVFEDGVQVDADTWWSPVVGNRQDGYEAQDPYCPTCEELGEETGEREFD